MSGTCLGCQTVAAAVTVLVGNFRRFGVELTPLAICSSSLRAIEAV